MILSRNGLRAASIVRPAQLLKVAMFRRCVSSDIQQKDQQAGESNTATDTGVIHKTEQETLLFFDNVYPRQLSMWSPLSWMNTLFFNQSRDAVRAKIQNLASPKDNPIHGLVMRSTIPVKRDGGVFATFVVPYRYTKAEANVMISKNTIAESSKGALSMLTGVSAFPVKGVPWIEDLRRLPSTTIKVKFQGPVLTEEELYSLFRRYGTIVNIFPCADGKDFALVRYRSYRGAICAKNCVSGIEINNTVLHIQYEEEVKNAFISNFFVNHTRIAVPVFIALLSIVAVLIFDPIREFFIEQKITHKYSLSLNNYWVKQLRDITNSTVSSFKSYIGANDNSHVRRHLWDERMDRMNDLKMWLEENNNTFVIVRGPRGSGKRDLVMEHTLHDRDNVLYLDCDKMIKSRTDAKFLRSVAQEIGYFPIFPWIGSVTGIVDLMVQGLTGQKTGLSESKETQFRNILTTSLMAIRRIALKKYKPVINDGDSTINVKEEDFLQQHPEAKPVVVIDRFAGKSDINGFVYKELADWTAMLVQMNVAHVIFLTETITSNQILSESLPNQVFKNMILSDASRENARSYVLSQLHDHATNFIKPLVPDAEKEREEVQENSGDIIVPLEEQDIDPHFIKELDETLDPLGGRMLDLQAFVRRVKSGEEPKKALEKMVEQASEQITQIFLSDKVEPIKSAQAWELIELLNEKPVVKYEDIVFRPLFKAAPEIGILELENNGLVTVSRDRGVLKDIRPAKPLFKAAFQYLLSNGELSTVLKTRYYLKVIGFENGRIKKWEEELPQLGKIKDPKIFKSRVDYLSGKISLSSEVINNCEKEIKLLSANSKKR